MLHRKEMENIEGKGDDEIKKVWSIIVSICFCMVLTLIVLFHFGGIWGIKTFVVTSGSMEPMYPVGSLIYVKKVAPETIHVGEAITFYMDKDGTVATHQVYEIEQSKKQFRTQGINNRDEKGNILQDALPVLYDNLIGKPIWCIPRLGNLKRFCTTAPGCYWVMVVGAVMTGISIIIENSAKKKCKREQGEEYEKNNKNKCYALVKHIRLR